MTTIADTITEVELVKFCPHCSSDNVDIHPDEDNIYLRFEPEDGTWLKCYSCNTEFQTYDALPVHESPITLWNNRKDT
jgi:hypothetical protein